MKKAEFVRVTAETDGYGFVKGLTNRFDGAEDIIRERIESGWEFCGHIPLVTRGTGEIETMSLVFQKEE